MRNVLAVAERELRSYFASPVAYVVTSLFLLGAGLLFAGGLNAPSTATVVRFEDGEVLMTDGPFAEGKEYLGGFSIIQAPHLDAALEWARKLARVLPLPIEVRPFRSGVDD